MSIPAIDAMAEPVRPRRVVAAEPVGFALMSRMMLGPPGAMLVVPVLTAGNVVLHGAVLDPGVAVLAGPAPMGLPVVAARVVMAPQLGLPLAPLLALGIVAAGDRLLQRVMRVLVAMAASNAHPVAGLLVVVIAEPVAVFDGIMMPLVLVTAVLVGFRLAVVVRRVMGEPMMGCMMLVPLLAAVAAVVRLVHLVVLCVTDLPHGGVCSILVASVCLVKLVRYAARNVGRAPDRLPAVVDGTHDLGLLRGAAGHLKAPPKALQPS